MYKMLTWPYSLTRVVLRACHRNILHMQPNHLNNVFQTFWYFVAFQKLRAAVTVGRIGISYCFCSKFSCRIRAAVRICTMSH